MSVVSPYSKPCPPVHVRTLWYTLANTGTYLIVPVQIGSQAHRNGEQVQRMKRRAGKKRTLPNILTSPTPPRLVLRPPLMVQCRVREPVPYLRGGSPTHRALMFRAPSTWYVLVGLSSCTDPEGRFLRVSLLR
jgi:hypothetical protein